MTKFSYNRENNPEYIKRQILENASEKIKQSLGQEEFKITPLVEKRLSDAARDIRRDIGAETSKDEILELALEKIYFDQGGWPEKLQEKYINLIAMRIENKIAAGGELYKAIGEVLTELKRRGIEVDGRLIEEKVKEINR